MYQKDSIRVTRTASEGLHPSPQPRAEAQRAESTSKALSSGISRWDSAQSAPAEKVGFRVGPTEQSRVCTDSDSLCLSERAFRPRAHHSTSPVRGRSCRTSKTLRQTPPDSKGRGGGRG